MDKITVRFDGKQVYLLINKKQKINKEPKLKFKVI